MMSMLFNLSLDQAPDNRRTKTTSLALALFLCMNALPAIASSNPFGQDKKKFDLKAIKEDMLQRDRGDAAGDDGSGLSLDRGRDTAGSGSGSGVGPLTGAVDDAETLGGMLPPPINQADFAAPPRGDGGPLAETQGPQQNAAPPQQDDDGRMVEYGVDWRTWVSKLADRWFFVLKQMEERSGYNFHTARPALIHFTCHVNGQISDVYLKQTSGIPVYDQMQVQALLQCVPLHAFPKGTKRVQYTLVQGWESHPRRAGEQDYRPGSFGGNTPMEVVQQWIGRRR